MNNFLALNQAPEKPTLIIFPHAGALPIKYERWSRGKLEQNFNILIYNKPLVRNWTELIQDIKAQFMELQTADIFVLGHSMGSLIAFYSSRSITTKNFHLFLSGMNPPSAKQIAHFKEFSSMNLKDLTKTMITNGGITQELQQFPDMLERVISTVRDDFKLLATIDNTLNLEIKSKHKYQVLHASNDQLCSLKEMKSWKKYFKTTGETKIFPGDHFYLFDHQDVVHDYLVEVMLNNTKIIL